MYSLEDNTTSIDIDDYYVSFDAGLPKMSYKMNDIIGDGSIVTGLGSLEGRTAKISRAFVKENESDRDLFLSWFTRPNYNTIYLRRTTTNFNGISQIYPQLSGGEGFAVRNFNFSKDVGFEMLMPDPYFESTAQTNSTFNIASTALHSTSITISANKIFPVFELTASTNGTSFEIKINNDYGFHINYNYVTNDVIKVTTSGSELLMYVNDNRVDGYFSANDTPFEFVYGVNNIYVKSGVGTLNIKYYDRRL